MREKEQLRIQFPFQVQFYNCWEQPNEQMYWNQFITSRHLLPKDKKIAIVSVFGKRKILDKLNTDFKIFYTAENLKRPILSKYADHCLGRKDIDLAIGFEVFEDERYIRFPLWMDYMFPAESTADDIREKCKQLRFPMIDKKFQFCCMIASHGGDGLRKEMYEKVQQIGPVNCAGRYLHNDDSLQHDFGDNKRNYMQQYIFNICPENTSAYGYTTEKIFEAISCGCIPIYWGAELADKEVINEDAIIFWDRKNKGKDAIKQITELYSNPKLLDDFLAQPRLLPTAEEYILDTFASIESKLRTIINSK